MAVSLAVDAQATSTSGRIEDTLQWTERDKMPRHQRFICVFIVAAVASVFLLDDAAAISPFPPRSPRPPKSPLITSACAAFASIAPTVSAGATSKMNAAFDKNASYIGSNNGKKTVLKDGVTYNVDYSMKIYGSKDITELDGRNTLRDWYRGQRVGQGVRDPVCVPGVCSPDIKMPAVCSPEVCTPDVLLTTAPITFQISGLAARATGTFVASSSSTEICFTFNPVVNVIMSENYVDASANHLTTNH
eukprot:gene10882-17004_t